MIIRKRIIILLFLSGYAIPATYGQQINEMIKNVIIQTVKNFKEVPPENIEEEVISNAIPFIPPNGEIDNAMIKECIAALAKKITIGDFENGYTEIDGNEYPTNNVELKLEYYDFPNFKNTAVYFTIESATDSTGKNILMTEEEQNKYAELGIIEGNSYPINGEVESEIWLSRELDYRENITIKGTYTTLYPTSYQTIVLGLNEISKPKSIEGFTFTLLEVNKNTFIYKAEGDRYKLDNIQKLFLNKEDKPFNYYSSTGTADYIYEEAKKYNFELTEQQINELAAKFDPGEKYNQVFKVTVGGTFDKAVFYTTQEEGQQSLPFAVSFIFE